MDDLSFFFTVMGAGVSIPALAFFVFIHIKENILERRIEEHRYNSMLQNQKHWQKQLDNLSDGLDYETLTKRSLKERLRDQAA